MPGPRSYEDPCGLARALDLIGERWALLIVRELLHGPRRFTDLRAGLPGASRNVLSQRLRELEACDLVRRTTRGPAAYELTDRGLELHPILLLLGRWGTRHVEPPPGDLGIDALLLALESSFDVEAAGDLHAIWELQLDGEPFTIETDGHGLAIQRGTPRSADAVIITDPETLRGLVFGDRTLAESPVELLGDKRMARTFLRLFTRPARATHP